MNVDTKRQDEATGVPSFEDLYLGYRSKLIRFFTGKGLEQDIAEDLSQEVFFRFLRSDKPLESEDHARNYLYRIAQNLLIDHFRKHNGNVRIQTLAADDVVGELIPYLVAEEADPVENLIHDEVSLDIRSAVSRLPLRYARAIELKEYEGLSYREIAAWMGLSQKAVESLLHRAKAQLKRDLAETGKKRGGWWSGILVTLRGMGKRARAPRLLRRAGCGSRGVSLGIGSAGAGKGLLDVVAVMLLLVSLAGTGVAAALSSGGDAPAPVRLEEYASPPVVEGSDPEQTFTEDVPRPAFTPENVKTGDFSQDAAARETAPAMSGQLVTGDGALLSGAAGTVRGIIVSAGSGLDIILADLGCLIGSLYDPLAGLLLCIGMPQRMLEVFESLAGMEEAREVSSSAVDGLVGGTCLLEETVSGILASPAMENSVYAPAPAPPAAEPGGTAGSPDKPAPAGGTGSATLAPPPAPWQEKAPGTPAADTGQETEGATGEVNGLLEDITGAVENLLQNLLPF